MSSNVITRPSKQFQKDFKRLLKKYPSLKNELAALRDDLQVNPKMGISLGNNTYKIRLAIKSKGTGKSGGARVISYVETELIAKIENTIVTLLTIYDKAEIDSVSPEKILALLKNMKF